MSDAYPAPRRPIVPRTELRPMPPWTWLAIAGIVVGLLILGGVFLQISRNTTVPDLVGKDQGEILLLLKEAGLKLGHVRQVETTQAPAGQVLSQTPKAGLTVRKGTSVSVTIAIEMVAIAVPDLSGKDTTSAVQAVQQAGLTPSQASVYSTAAVGMVVGQIPQAGVRVALGDQVTVVVSGGTTAKTVPAPSVVGQARDVATETIRAAGLTMKAIEAFSDSVPTGTVIAQSPKAGTIVKAGSMIAVMVSKGRGNGTATVPGVTGNSQSSASDAVTGRGLTPVVVAQPSLQAAGTVIDQFPSANTTAVAGSEVLIVVSRAGSSMIAVPSLVGMTQAQAEAQLSGLGLQPRVVSSISASQAIGSVSEQFPAAGTMVPAGSDIVFGVVRAGPQ